MVTQEIYRIGCVRSGKAVWITEFDEIGVFCTSVNVRDAAVFDSYTKVHHAKAFLEACNPKVPFDISRYTCIPCRVARRPVTAQRAANG